MIGSSGRAKSSEARLRSYSATECCELLRCSRYKFNELVRSGQLKAFRIGTSYACMERDLLDFIERRMTRTIAT